MVVRGVLSFRHIQGYVLSGLKMAAGSTDFNDSTQDTALVDDQDNETMEVVSVLSISIM